MEPHQPPRVRRLASRRMPRPSAAVIVLVLSIVPVYIASRLTSGTESTGRT